MRDLFKPWRRKIGAATLVMACVFAAGWVRSLSTLDFIRLPRGNCAVISGSQRFYVFFGSSVMYHMQRADTGNDMVVKLFPSPHEIIYLYDVDSLPAPDQLGVYRSADATQPLSRMIPYWSLVIPLTLLSACLLLSKRRPKLNQPVSHA